MPLRLAPEVQAVYDQTLKTLNDAKQKAVAAGDQATAKAMRQEIHKLYKSFEPLQLPPEPPSYYEQCWEAEEAMTLEQRIDRIEQHLKIGRYADNFGLTKDQIEGPPWNT